MKEQYYTNNLIDPQSQAFLREVSSLRAKHDLQINHQKTALLVIDMQKFFVDEASHACVPSAKAIIPRILKLQNYCLENGIKVIQTRHGNDKENAGMMAKWWGEDRLLESTDPSSEIIVELANPKIKPIAKSQYDAFYNSSLDLILKSSGIEQLIITGVMTHLCCETTARVAFTRGYEVFFTVDGTATYNRKLHLGSLMGLAHGFAMPMLVDEILGQLTT